MGDSPDPDAARTRGAGHMTNVPDDTVNTKEEHFKPTGTIFVLALFSAGIVLHHFAVWAGMTEGKREGSKFVVAERQPETYVG